MWIFWNFIAVPARGPHLASKNNHGTSHPCPRKYTVSQWYVSKSRYLCLRTFRMISFQNWKLYTSYAINLPFHDWNKQNWIINCHCLSIHSVFPHRILVWGIVVFILLTKSFKLGSDCRQLNQHAVCDIESIVLKRCGKRMQFWALQYLDIQSSSGLFSNKERTNTGNTASTNTIVNSSSCREKATLDWSNDTFFYICGQFLNTMSNSITRQLNCIKFLCRLFTKHTSYQF